MNNEIFFVKFYLVNSLYAYLCHAVRGTVYLNLVNRYVCEIITLSFHTLYFPFLMIDVAG